MTAAGNDQVQLYDELKGFLQSDRVDVRLAATEAILQISETEEHRQRILQTTTTTADTDTATTSSSSGLLPCIIRNCSYDNTTSSDESSSTTANDVSALMIPVNSLHALVYLSSLGSTANQCIDLLLKANMIARLLEIVLTNTTTTTTTTKAQQEAWRSKINFAMALMANLTRHEEGAVDMVGRTLPEQAIVASSNSMIEKLDVRVTMDLLLDRYMNPSYIGEFPLGEGVEAELTVEQLDSQPWDPYQHFAAVLMNTTQTEQGRKFLLQLHYTTGGKGEQQQEEEEEEATDATCNFQRLLPHLKSANPIRRRGTAGMIRNVCLDKDSAWWLLNVVQLSKDILYPLAGPEELDVQEKQGLHPDLWLEGPDKKREPDQPTRLYLVESLLLLCASGRASRERLRLDRTYVIVKWADMVEESEEISECFNECVQYLRRDEAGTQEGSSDAFVSSAYKRILESSSTAALAVASKDKDVDYDVID